MFDASNPTIINWLEQLFEKKILSASIFFPIFKLFDILEAIFCQFDFFFCFKQQQSAMIG